MGKATPPWHTACLIAAVAIPDADALRGNKGCTTPHGCIEHFRQFSGVLSARSGVGGELDWRISAAGRGCG